MQEINVKSPYFPHYCAVKSPLSAGVWGLGLQLATFSNEDENEDEDWYDRFGAWNENVVHGGISAGNKNI